MARADRPARRPDPPPLEADDTRVVAVGTAVWALLALALLPLLSRLRADGHLWWLATCAIGAVLGLVGLLVLRRRDRRRVRRAARDHPGGVSAAADPRRAPTPHP